MKTKQKSIRVFEIEIESGDDAISYFKKNIVLFREFLILLKGSISNELLNILAEQKIVFAILGDFKDDHKGDLKIANSDLEASRNSTEFYTMEFNGDQDRQKEQERRQEQELQEAVKNIQLVEPGQKNHNLVAKTITLNRPLRSGEEIVSDGDVTVFGRVNGGSKIETKGNVLVFGQIEGLVICEGDYVVGSIGASGVVLFGGEVFAGTDLDGKIKKFTKNGQSIEIKDFL